MQIWKYTLPDGPCVIPIEMPRGSKVLCAQLHGGVPTIWAKVDPRASKRLRVIAVVGTGRTLSDAVLEYIDTLQDANGSVWHVFVETAS